MSRGSHLPAFLLGLALLWGPAGPGERASDAAATAQRQRLCGLLRGCGLPEPPGSCAESLTRGVSGVVYDTARCQDARELSARGVAPGSDLGLRVYQFLGQRYQVVYAVEGEVPISRTRLDFLVDDLPLATKLLSHFQKIPYAAEYLDPSRTRFKASRGRDLTGEAELVSGSTAEGRLFYFGYGTSDLGLWKLRGRGLVRVDYAPVGPDGKRLFYRIRVVATPANAVINAIMKMGLFKSIVRRRIRDVVTDIVEATRKLDSRGLPGSGEGKGWTPEETERLTAFLKLP